jgi:N-acylneuraminate cytidylyltransferase/CMP-N,N'-diacetyllegionaminic acid synthase
MMNHAGSDKTCLAVITARGGSKGVPRKNVRLLNGHPLIDYPIQVARSCPYITRVIVTTESEEIRQVAIDCGAEAPFLRPAKLATDTAKQEDAILHVMDWCQSQGEVFDYLCLLCPTSPLGQVETLSEAFRLLFSRLDAEAIFSVTECDFSPLLCNTLRPDGLMKDWTDPKLKWLNRQEFKTYYKLCGLVAVSTWEAFRREKTFLHDSTLSVVVDPVEALDINNPVDFFIAGRLLENGFVKSKHLSDYVRLS